MEKQFCTYEISKELIGLYFDRQCLVYFDIDKKLCPVDTDYNFFRNISEGLISAPLWQQAIDWLREEHKLFIEPRVYLKEDGTNSYVGWVVGDNFDTEEPVYLDSYYLARESAIKEAIEIVKTKINGKSN